MSTDITLEEQIEKVAGLRAALFRQRIAELAKIYGSVRAVGRALNIDHVYLHRLASGEKQNPSQAVMRKLGLAR